MVINKMKQYFIKDSYSFLKEKYILEDKSNFPLMLNIEPTLACNLKCSFCPSHSEELKHLQSRAIGYMDFDLYKKIIDECSEYKNLLVLNMHKDGESSLHPKFAQMIKYAKEKEVAKIIHFNTNCLMSKEKVDAILEADIDDITLSLDATNAQVYKALKGVDRFSEVIQIAKYFYEKRDKLKSKTFIRVKMIVSEQTYKYKDEFFSFWKDIADEVQFQNIHNFAGALENISNKHIDRYACVFPFYSFAINWNGKVTLCHRDYNEDDIMGDVVNNSIYEIYNNQKYKLYRLKLLNNNLDALPMCKECDNWDVAPNIDQQLKEKYEI